MGSAGRLIRLDGSVDPAGVRRTLEAPSRDAAVAGVILQLPLPAGLAPDAIIEALDPSKDLDGIQPLNAGRVARGTDGFAPSCAEAAVHIP